MGQRRFSFADEFEGRKPPPNVWLPRALIVGIMVSAAAFFHLRGYF